MVGERDRLPSSVVPGPRTIPYDLPEGNHTRQGGRSSAMRQLGRRRPLDRMVGASQVIRDGARPLVGDRMARLCVSRRILP
jgi:hypothetical protein